MTITAVDIKRVFFDTKGKESFTVEYNQITDEITLTVDGIERNRFKTKQQSKTISSLRFTYRSCVGEGVFVC